MRLIPILILLFVSSCSLVDSKKYRSYDECHDELSCVKTIHKIIARNWYLPNVNTEGLETKLRIKLGDNKLILSIVIVKSSGVREFDMSVVKAIRKAQDFRELNGLKEEEFQNGFKQFILLFWIDQKINT